MNTWTRIAEANVKNYENHPKLQLTIVAAGVAVVAVVITSMARRLSRIRINPYTGRYSK